MRNGTVRILLFIMIAALLCAATAALAAAESPSSSAPDGIFDALQRDMLVMKDRLAVMLSALPDLPKIGSFLVRRLTKQYEPEYIWVLGLQLAAIFAGAVAGETVARRLFRPMHRLLPSIDVRTEFGRLGALLVNAVI